MKGNEGKKTVQILRGGLIRAVSRKEKGVSIIIALIIVTLVISFALGITNKVLRSTRMSSDAMNNSVAYYAGEGALEGALFASKNFEIGQGGKGEYVKAQGAIFDGKYQIYGLNNLGKDDGKVWDGSADKFITPAPYTGNAPWTNIKEGARKGGGCNYEKPPTMKDQSGNTNGSPSGEKYWFYNGGTIPIAEIEHPCNWGKIKFGEKVTIPLYGFDKNCEWAPGTPCVAQKFSEFKIKLRTPCIAESEWCEFWTQRYDLDCLRNTDTEAIFKCELNTANNKGKGDIVVLWQIEGNDAGAIFRTLLPYESIVKGAITGFKYTDNLGGRDTQINESKINQARIDLDKNVVLKNSKIVPFLNGELDGVKTLINDFLATIEKPILKLSVLGNLKDYNLGNTCPGDVCPNVPYLEYQVEFEELPLFTDYVPANPSRIIRAEGSSGQMTQRFEVKIPYGTSELEYVIQQ